MKAILVGGPFEGETDNVNSSTESLQRRSADGVAHEYRRFMNTAYDIVRRGHAANEEAIFVHNTFLEKDHEWVVNYIREAGF